MPESPATGPAPPTGRTVDEAVLDAALFADGAAAGQPTASARLQIVVDALHAAVLAEADLPDFLDIALPAIHAAVSPTTQAGRDAAFMHGTDGRLVRQAGPEPPAIVQPALRDTLDSGHIHAVRGENGLTFWSVPLPGSPPVPGALVLCLPDASPPDWSLLRSLLQLIGLSLQALRRGKPEGLNLDDPFHRALSEHAIVAVTDRKGRIIAANDRFCAISGYSRAELIGQTHAMLNSGTHPRGFFRDMWRTISAGQTWHGDVCNRTKDGSLYWLRSTVVPVIGKDGRPERYIAVRVDLTEQKRALTMLRRTNIQHETLAQVARIGGWRYDVAADVLSWDQITRELHNIDGAFEPSVAYVMSRCDPEHRETVRHAIDRCLSEGTGFELEVPITTASGRHAWVRAIGRPETDGENVVAIHGTFQDITESRRREQAVARLKTRFEAIFDNSESLIFIKDREGRLQLVNRAYRAASGIESVDGLRDGDLYTPETAEALSTVDQGVFATGEPFFGEETIRFGDGREIVYLSSKFLIEDPVIGDRVLVGIATDITAQKQQAAALETARQQAEEANAAKSRFLATMSHEIRTPMNGVVGMAEILEAQMQVPERRRMMRVIRESGEVLMALLNDILDLSKIEAGGMQLETAPFHLGDIARQVEALHASRAEAHGTRLKIRPGHGIDAPRLGDAHRLRQILHNLVGNAVKFTEGGEITIAMRALAGDAVELAVSDTGIGMSAEAQARIFEEFAQAGTDTARQYGGTGLGLTIVKRLVDAMQGRIDVASAPGEGSRFTLTLPLPEAPASESAAAGTAAPAPLPPGLRAIAADDNAVNRQVLAAFLDMLGVQHAMVEDGTAAIAARFEVPADILLLDVTMPDIDGPEALAVIRAREVVEGLAPLPAVAVTANAMTHQIAAYLAAGFAGHVAKPITREALEAAIAAAVTRGAAGG
jgi:PAS domain S-box-containing protein